MAASRFILPVFIRRDRPGKNDHHGRLDWHVVAGHTDRVAGRSRAGRQASWIFQFTRRHREILTGRGSESSLHQLRTLSRGDIRSGLLLAVGSRPPDIYKDKDLVSITLTVVDQWDCEQKVTMQMKMNRRPVRAEAIHTSARSPLLSRHDVIRANAPVCRTAAARGGQSREGSGRLPPCYWRTWLAFKLSMRRPRRLPHPRDVSTNFPERSQTGEGRFQDGQQYEPRPGNMNCVVSHTNFRRSTNEADHRMSTTYLT